MLLVLTTDFIYSEYASTLGTHGNSYRKMVWQIAEDYACATALLRLPGYSPMPAFGEILDVPLVVRHAQRSRTQVNLLSRLLFTNLQGGASLHSCSSSDLSSNHTCAS